MPRFASVLVLSMLLPRPASADDVRVRFDAPPGTELRWTPPDETDSRVVCVAPCADARLSRDGVYVAAPPRRTASKAFALEKRSGLELDVRPNRLGMVIGILAIVAGGASIAMGTAMTIRAHRDGEKSVADGVFGVIGPVFIGAGVIEVVGGAVALFLDTGTSVHQHEQTRWDTF